MRCQNVYELMRIGDPGWHSVHTPPTRILNNHTISLELQNIHAYGQFAEPTKTAQPHRG